MLMGSISTRMSSLHSCDMFALAPANCRFVESQGGAMEEHQATNTDMWGTFYTSGHAATSENGIVSPLTTSPSEGLSLPSHS